jgi:hypothetical protein
MIGVARLVAVRRSADAASEIRPPFRRRERYAVHYKVAAAEEEKDVLSIVE